MDYLIEGQKTKIMKKKKKDIQTQFIILSVIWLEASHLSIFFIFFYKYKQIILINVGTSECKSLTENMRQLPESQLPDHCRQRTRAFILYFLLISELNTHLWLLVMSHTI